MVVMSDVIDSISRSFAVRKPLSESVWVTFFGVLSVFDQPLEQLSGKYPARSGSMATSSLLPIYVWDTLHKLWNAGWEMSIFVRTQTMEPELSIIGKRKKEMQIEAVFLTHVSEFSELVKKRLHIHNHFIATFHGFSMAPLVQESFQDCPALEAVAGDHCCSVCRTAVQVVAVEDRSPSRTVAFAYQGLTCWFLVDSDGFRGPLF